MQVRRPALVALLSAAALAPAYRRWACGWGSTPEERREALPGDEVPTPRPGLNATRAITIAAPPAAVWPWILQIGTGKAGWYSYDLLDNLGRPSARDVLPQWQQVRVGDPAAPMNPLAPVTSSPWRVLHLEPARTMVWRHPAMGTWAWVLRPAPGGATRLVTRLRLTYRVPAGAAFAPVLEVADFPMFRRMLLGIRARAERRLGALR